MPAEADLRAEVGRAVEAIGKGPIEIGRHGDAVGHVDRDRAVIVDDAENFVKALFGRCMHFDLGVARVGAALADFDVLDDVGAAVREDHVQHLWQQQRIDDVTL